MLPVFLYALRRDARPGYISGRGEGREGGGGGEGKERGGRGEKRQRGGRNRKAGAAAGTKNGCHFALGVQGGGLGGGYLVLPSRRTGGLLLKALVHCNILQDDVLVNASRRPPRPDELLGCCFFNIHWKTRNFIAWWV